MYLESKIAEIAIMGKAGDRRRTSLDGEVIGCGSVDRPKRAATFPLVLLLVPPPAALWSVKIVTHDRLTTGSKGIEVLRTHSGQRGLLCRCQLSRLGGARRSLLENKQAATDQEQGQQAAQSNSHRAHTRTACW